MKSLLWRHRYILIKLLLIASCLCPTANFADTSAIDRQLSKLISLGKFDRAQNLLRSVNATQIDLLFYNGRVLKAAGRYREAIDIFREILRLEPSYLNARRELAHTLYLNGQLDVAQYHFNDLLKDEQNAENQKGYRKFLDAIDRNKPVGFSGQFSILPSTNINRGTRNSSLNGFGEISESSKESSGTGLSTRVSGYYRKRVDEKSRFVLTGSVASRIYGNNDYNSHTGLVSLSFEHAFDKGLWSIAPFYRYNWRADDSDSTAIGAQFQLQRRVSPIGTLIFSTSIEDRKYIELADTDHDGLRISTSLGLHKKLRPDLTILGGLRFQHNWPERENLKYREYAVFAKLTKSWKSGLNIGVGVDLGKRDFLGFNQIFRISGGTVFVDAISRADDFYSLSISAGNKRISYRGFTPISTCSYTKNNSNISLFEYSVTSCNFALTRNF